MNPIRRRIAATTLANPSSTTQAAWRGAIAGLRWGHFFAAIAVVLMLLPLFALVILIALAGTSPPKDPNLLELFRGLVGMYVVTCGWGVVIGAIVGTTVYTARRRGSPSDKAVNEN